MKIIEWNCQGAFRLKNKEILELKPDILIVPECEKEEWLKFGNLMPKPNDFFWYADTKGKGIGIFSYSKFKFKLLKEFNPKFRYVIPLEVSDENNSFILFAIWAMDNKENPIISYIGQVWLAINYYQSILSNNCILIGDFNSNKIWDKKERIGNHSDVVNYLEKLNIESLYHKQYNEPHGEESLKTFFLYRKFERPYHIDYIFTSQEIIKNGYNISVGNIEKWIDKSDHLPLILEINTLNCKTRRKETFVDFISGHLNSFRFETKEKFKQELSEIRNLAENQNLKTDEKEKKYLLESVEIIKQIDELITKLKTDNNSC